MASVNGQSGFYINFPKHYSNWSQANYFSMNLKTNVSGEFILQIWNATSLNQFTFPTNSNELVYIGRIVPGLQLNSYQDKNSNFTRVIMSLDSSGMNLSNVTHLVIGVQTSSNSMSLEANNLTYGHGELAIIRTPRFLGIKFVRSYSNYSIYQVSHPLPLIYSSINYTVAKSDQAMISKLENYTGIATSTYVANDSYLLSNLSKNPPKVYFSQHDTTFSVSVKNSTGKFILLFAQDFSSGWILVNGPTNPILGSVASQQYYHFEVDGYMNAWIVNKTGNFTLTIFFKADEYSVMGSAVSYSFAFLTFILILVPFLRYRKRTI